MLSILLYMAVTPGWCTIWTLTKGPLVLWHLVGLASGRTWQLVTGWEEREVKGIVFLLLLYMVIDYIDWAALPKVTAFAGQSFPQLQHQLKPQFCILAPSLSPFSSRVLGSNGSGDCQPMLCWFTWSQPALFWTVPLPKAPQLDDFSVHLLPAGASWLIQGNTSPQGVYSLFLEADLIRRKNNITLRK